MGKGTKTRLQKRGGRKNRIGIWNLVGPGTFHPLIRETPCAIEWKENFELPLAFAWGEESSEEGIT